MDCHGLFWIIMDYYMYILLWMIHWMIIWMIVGLYGYIKPGWGTYHIYVYIFICIYIYICVYKQYIYIYIYTKSPMEIPCTYHIFIGLNGI